MMRFDLSRREYDRAALERRAAQDSDVTQWCLEPGVYHVDGAPAIIYGLFTKRYDRMLWATSRLPFFQEKRTVAGGNIKSGVRISTSKKDGLGKSTIFGFRPPIAYTPSGMLPGPCALQRSHPAEHGIICDFGELMTELYREFAPECAARHSKLLEDVLPEYVIPGTVFTSGIVNQHNALKYHFDKGNFEGVMSCMAVFRQMTSGGSLVIPELGAGFPLEDHSFLLVDGQRYMHGVTPIKRMNRTAYRYSVVYYALRAMARCETAGAELERVRRKRVDIERRRL